MPSVADRRRSSRPAIAALALAAASLAPDLARADDLVAATLPSSRSAVIGATVTAFATIINASGRALTGCTVGLSGYPVTISYTPTDPNTNQPVGSTDTPFPLAIGAAQTLVLSFTPSAALSADLPLQFGCTGATTATSIPGVDTLLLSASATQPPDIVALVATPSNDGVARMDGIDSPQAFAVATVNLGVEAEITVSVDTGGTTLPVTLSICQSNPATAACLSPPAPSVTLDIAANATPTFSVFVDSSGAVPFAPATARAFVRFTDAADVVRGATSVALTNGVLGGTVAPYQDVSLGYDEASLVQAAGLKDLTFAFVEANGTSCQAAWGGLGPVASDTTLGPYVEAIRGNGGDVIFSFGGAVGYELADKCTSADSLQAQYQVVVTQYQATRLDFDIEYDTGDSIDDEASIDRRNQALAALQQANPGLIIRYTVPVAVNGLESNALYVLQSALKYGVSVVGVNIMTMDYGPPADPSTEGANAISSATATLGQLARIGMNAKLGIIVLIGKNDTWTSSFPEQFTQTDAQDVVTYALQNNAQIDLLSFWELSRDQPCPGGGPDENGCSSLAQTPYQFSQILGQF